MQLLWMEELLMVMKMMVVLLEMVVVVVGSHDRAPSNPIAIPTGGELLVIS